MNIKLKAAQYEPLSPDERIRGVSTLLPVQDRGGFVFLLAYAKKESADSQALMQILNDQIHRLAESFGREANPQHRFEQFLGALNETLAAQVREGRWNVPVSHVHAIVGIATPQQMFLSGTGELTALFLHRTPSQRYQIFNLFHGIQTEQSLPTWEKPFAVVLDGDLHADDVFCVSDKDLQKDIDADELNAILTTLPPAGSVEKIRQLFPHKDSFMLLTVKASDADEARAQKPHMASPTSGASIETLGETLDATSRLMEDQRPKLSSIVSFAARWIKAKFESKSRLLQDLNSKDTAFNAFKRGARTVARIAWHLGKYGARHASRAFAAMRDVKRREKIAQRVKLNGAAARDRAASLLHLVRRAPKSTKLLTLGICVAVLALIVGITAMNKSQARAKDDRAYQEQILTIEDLIERGAGAVIYQDENQARNLYLNAQTLIEGLPTSTPEHTVKATELASDVQIAMNEIRHLVTIPNPPLLADMAQAGGNVIGTSLVMRDGNIYVLGSDGRTYVLNRAQKSLEAFISPQAPAAPMNAAQEDGRVYYLGNDGNVYALDFEEKDARGTGIGDSRWVDLEAYANRLYLLRPTVEGAQGQVVRYDRSGSSFTNEREWITSRTVPFDNAVSVAVDGNVFILMRDGRVARFDSGSEVGWETGLIEPQITEAAKLWTDADSRYVYVLEPPTNRLAVFQKDTGAFLIQYRSDAFAGLTDFAVDEKGYTIYLLAGQKLYSIAASHIE